MKAIFAILLIGGSIGLAALMPPEESIDCVTSNGIALSLRTCLILFAVTLFAIGGLKRESGSRMMLELGGGALIVFLLSQAHILDLFGRCPN